ncbi:MAG: proprotein convertase P-domain-containing protein [Ferruginibacter sp.]
MRKSLHLLVATLALHLVMNAQQNVGIGTVTPTDQLHTTGTVRFQNYGSGTAGGTRIMQIDSAGRLTVAAINPVFRTLVGATIPDNGCSAGNGISAPIGVSGMGTAVASSKIAVQVNITHGFDQDLYIYLVAPNGAILQLAAAVGGSGSNFSNTIFTDTATTSITAGSAPFSGTYKPSGSLSPTCTNTGTSTTFASIGGGSIIPNGTWTLKVYDGVSLVAGTLLNWSISFGGPESINTVNQNGYIPQFNYGNIVPSALYQNAGNVGIGTVSPAATLDVAGTIRIQGGTPAVGKVLTANTATGTAVWAALPASNTGFTVMPVSTTTLSSSTNATLPFATGVNPFGFDDAAAFNNASHAYVVPATGTYSFTISLAVASGISVGTGFINAYIIRNGSGNYSSSAFLNTYAGQGFPHGASVTVLMKATAGDVITVGVSNNSGGPVTISNSSDTQFSGNRAY